MGNGALASRVAGTTSRKVSGRRKSKRRVSMRAGTPAAAGPRQARTAASADFSNSPRGMAPMIRASFTTPAASSSYSTSA